MARCSIRYVGCFFSGCGCEGIAKEGKWRRGCGRGKDVMSEGWMGRGRQQGLRAGAVCWVGLRVLWEHGDRVEIGRGGSLKLEGRRALGGRAIEGNAVRWELTA
jgi:hypothetical protein